MSFEASLWSILGRMRETSWVAWLSRVGVRRLNGAGGVLENIVEEPWAITALAGGGRGQYRAMNADRSRGTFKSCGETY